MSPAERKNNNSSRNHVQKQKRPNTSGIGNNTRKPTSAELSNDSGVFYGDEIDKQAPYHRESTLHRRYRRNHRFNISQSFSAETPGESPLHLLSPDLKTSTENKSGFQTQAPPRFAAGDASSRVQKVSKHLQRGTKYARRFRKPDNNSGSDADSQSGAASEPSIPFINANGENDYYNKLEPQQVTEEIDSSRSVYDPAEKSDPHFTSSSSSGTYESDMKPFFRDEKSTPPLRKAKTHRNKTTRLSFLDDEPKPASDRCSPTEVGITADIKKKLRKAHTKAERSEAKLDKAKKKLPKKLRPRVKATFDESTGKLKRGLRFEEEVKSKHEHLLGSLPRQAIAFVGNTATSFIHRKLHEVEHENVGVEASHKGATVAEGGLRSLNRQRRLAPYRKVEKLVRKTVKLNMKASYQQALADNPRLKSSILSRMAQKRKMKRQYAKAANEAKKAAKRAKKTGDIIGKAFEAVINFIASHPMICLVLAGLLLLILLLSAAVSSCSNLAVGGGSVIIASSYTAQDADIDNAELAYGEWETDLLMQINKIEASNPGYDEYVFNINDVSHNPYELMAYLTAKHQDFKLDVVQSDLKAIFSEQYKLTVTENIETRYRAVSKTDPATGDEYDNQEPYDWRVLNIALTSKPFADVIYSSLNTDERKHYNILMLTKGGRQYAGSPLDFNWLTSVSGNYGWRIHPATGSKDYSKGIEISVPVGTEVFAANDGIVTTGSDPWGYGLYLSVTRADGFVTKYAYLDSIIVRSGDTVKKGDLIAKSGRNSKFGGSMLHFEIIKNGRYLNPLYFSKTNDNGAQAMPGSPGGPQIPQYPGAPMSDPAFAALMNEAQKHLGKPYVFGASGPNAFDCSGFVCAVFTNSGVANIGRTTAQELFNQCTPVSRENLQPGDLVFLSGTYSTTNTVTHVAIYIGNGQVIHAGDPIQYASIDSAFWRSHMYGFGRIV